MRHVIDRTGAYLVFAAFTVLLSAAASGCGPPPTLVEEVAERNPDVLFEAETADSLVALTLDDGPHPDLTPQVLGVLAANDAKATFFLMGDHVEGNEAVVRRMVEEGHELGNHMMTAWPSVLLRPPAFRASLYRAHAQLAAFDTVRWFRPASGWFNERIRAEADSLNYDVALGSVYPNDAQNPFPSYHARYVLRQVRPGSVIILHEGMSSRRRVLTALRLILPELRRRGYRVVTLTELVQSAQVVPSK
jgi:peptidoglycan/xylan/chitin deacetylase (PgdA/CDA1 family)